MKRTPKDYDGTGATYKDVKILIGDVMNQIERDYLKKSKTILEAWPDIVGPKLSVMTKAHSFEGGILVIKVTSSTLYSLFSNHEKDRLLKEIQKRFEVVHKLVFKMG